VYYYLAPPKRCPRLTYGWLEWSSGSVPLRPCGVHVRPYLGTPYSVAVRRRVREYGTST
jgi:hypothetical protein